MTSYSPGPTRQKQAELFFRYALLGLLSCLVLVAGWIADVEQDAGGTSRTAALLLSGLPSLLLLGSFVRLFQLRRADEYVALLWSSATSAAVMTLVVSWLALNFLEGLVDGLIGAPQGSRATILSRFDIPSILTMLAFFGTLVFQRLRRA